MTRHYLTFSGARYHDTTRRIVEDAPRLGAEKVWVLDDWWLEHCRPGYWDHTAWFREHPNVRGVDWFCFKPFVILDTFRRLAPGDVLLYTDADTYPIADLSPLYDRCRNDGGVMLFNALGCHNDHWTKRDCFLVMGCDEPAYWYAQHAVARFALFEKGGAFAAKKLLWDWLAYTCNPLANTFDPSVLGPELPGFRQHRCEQSVLTNLAVRYGVRLYREACQFGEGSDRDKDIYPTTFHQVGEYSYDPGGHREGSKFCNVAD